MCFCYVYSWLHKCHSGWTGGGLVCYSGEEGVREQSQPEGVGLQGSSYVYNLCILYSNPLGFGGVVNISSQWWPPPPSPAHPSTGQTHCEPADQWLVPQCSDDRSPTGHAAVEETGSATFLAAWVAQVRSQSQTVGAVLTNAAIRGVLQIYYQTYWYSRVELIQS